MIGKRIRYFRNKNGITQKQLGSLLGFSEQTADVRVAQYESGERNPKKLLIDAMAEVFHISPYALTVPDKDDVVGVMHILFSLEDQYGLYVERTNKSVCLRINNPNGDVNEKIYKMIYLWQTMEQKLIEHEITKDKYDEWRYNFSEKEVKNWENS